MNPLLILSLKKLLTSFTILLNLMSAQVGKTPSSVPLFGAATVTPGDNYPTSTYNFSDNDIINAGDLNLITQWLGTRNSTDTTSLSWIASSSVRGLAQGGTGTSTIPTDSQVLSSNGSTGVWKNLTAGTNITVVSSTSALTINTVGIGGTFGGNGASGTLAIANGTTTIDCGGQRFCVREYISFSITGTGALQFTNPNASGTLVMILSQGNATVSSTANPTIDLRNMGGVPGTGGATSTSDCPGQAGSAGNGGAAESTQGTAGTHLDTCKSGGLPTMAGAWTPSWLFASTTVSVVTTSTSQASLGNIAFPIGGQYDPNASQALRGYVLPGQGGNGATGHQTGTGRAGGYGAGALYMEVGGAFNFTTGSTINSAGSSPLVAGTGSGTTNGHCDGGGGGGGSVLIKYATLTNNSGTVTVSGGTGTSGGGCGGGNVGNGGDGGNGRSDIFQQAIF